MSLLNKMYYFCCGFFSLSSMREILITCETIPEDDSFEIMDIQLLRRQDIYPSKDVLHEVLGEIYDVLDTLENQATQGDLALTFNWHYYRDSSAWLCKVSYKKKTVCWLSVWDGFFQTSFYFLERHLEGIAGLDIDNNSYTIRKEWGKMIPLIFRINNKNQLPHVFKMMEFKKKSK